MRITAGDPSTICFFHTVNMYRLLLILVFLTSAALADTWTVDDDGKADFDNIQAAVDAASDGDEVVVMPGTYTGSGSYVVNMNGKGILLRSQEGPQTTIVGKISEMFSFVETTKLPQQLFQALQLLRVQVVKVVVSNA